MLYIKKRLMEPPKPELHHGGIYILEKMIFAEMSIVTSGLHETTFVANRRKRVEYS